MTLKRHLPRWIAAPLITLAAVACAPVPGMPRQNIGDGRPATPATDAAPVSPPPPGAPPLPDWKLVWSDEFEGAAGTPPDPAKWTHEVGGNGFGNNELQFYTARPENSALDGQGNLAITVLREAYMNRAYTSARLVTRGKFEHGYGRFEARIKIPTGKGIWPAFWTLGNNLSDVGWPACGEIDIMEVIGSQPGVLHGTLHGPGYSGGAGLTSRYTVPGGQSLGSGFYTYSIEWEPGRIRFFLDGTLYANKTPDSLPTGRRWVYDHPMFLILNVAVGGAFPGNPDATLVLPQKMLVDHVRVYTR